MKITLKAARVNAGLTQDTVIGQLGISKTTLSNYEQGRTFPDVETGKALAALYGVSINDIIFLPSNRALSTKS